MKVLMINGSPHKDGCTNAALTIIADTLAEQGIGSEIFQLGTQRISGCVACGYCRKSGAKRCAIKDDAVNELIDKLEAADGLIVGTPVYYASPNGTLVSLLDRVFYAHGGYPHKPAAAIASARRAGTIVSVDELNKYFTISQMPVVSSTYWNEVHGTRAEDVAKDEEGRRHNQHGARRPCRRERACRGAERRTHRRCLPRHPRPRTDERG